MGAIAALLLGYLCGSIPFGLLLTRAAGLGDVRKIGSGNIGATNVLRTGNKALAAATLILDGLKGFAAVLAGQWLDQVVGGSSEAPLAMMGAMAGGFGALLGHLFPVWIGFMGGKGVATYIGVLFGLDWPMGLVFCAVWLATALITRYSSLAALVAVIAVPLLAWLKILAPGPATAALLSAMSILIIVKHSANIGRLMSGTESKIGGKASNPG